MKVSDLLKEGQFKQLTTIEMDKHIINGLYYGDLLSWVMSHAKDGEAWITVQTHMNIVAVASLLNLSCIIVPEGIDVEEDTINKANSVSIPILSTDLDAYGIFKTYYQHELKQ